MMARTYAKALSDRVPSIRPLVFADRVAGSRNCCCADIWATGKISAYNDSTSPSNVTGSSVVPASLVEHDVRNASRYTRSSFARIPSTSNLIKRAHRSRILARLSCSAGSITGISLPSFTRLVRSLSSCRSTSSTSEVTGCVLSSALLRSAMAASTCLVTSCSCAAAFSCSRSPFRVYAFRSSARRSAAFPLSCTSRIKASSWCLSTAVCFRIASVERLSSDIASRISSSEIGRTRDTSAEAARLSILPAFSRTAYLSQKFVQLTPRDQIAPERLCALLELVLRQQRVA
jgi:hypothetical protein